MGNVAGDSVLGAVASVVATAVGWTARRIAKWQAGVEQSIVDVQENATEAFLKVGIQLEVIDEKVDHLIERIAHVEGALGIDPPPWRGPERRRASPAQRAQTDRRRRRHK